MIWEKYVTEEWGYERDKALRRKTEFEEFIKNAPNKILEKEDLPEISWEIECRVRDPLNHYAWVILYYWGDCESEEDIPKRGYLYYNFPFTMQGVLCAIEYTSYVLKNMSQECGIEKIKQNAEQMQIALQEWKKRIEEVM